MALISEGMIRSPPKAGRLVPRSGRVINLHKEDCFFCDEQRINADRNKLRADS